MNANRLLSAMVLLPLSGMALAGCVQASSQAGATEQGPDEAKIQVVTTTNVYRDIAQSVGGEQVQATEVISSPAQDPHSYEPSARDKLTISKAQIVVSNGGGYDDFMDQLVSSLPADSAVEQLHAVDSSPIPELQQEAQSHDDHAEHGHEVEGHEGHSHAEYNEHVWFDLESMSALADTLAVQFGEVDPQNAELFTSNAATLNSQLQDLEQRLAEADLSGKSFAMTEPVPFYLLQDAGMKDATPAGMSEAVESGGDIAPKTLKAFEDELVAGGIDLLAYNIQSEGPDTLAIRATAEAHTVPVVEFTETMEQDQNFIDWMSGHIDQLERAAQGS